MPEPVYPPSPEFVRNAHVKGLEAYRELYRKAAEKPEEFWGEQAKRIEWFKAPTKVLEWKLPHAKWFADGKLNIRSE